jgi:hypothetical protein
MNLRRHIPIIAVCNSLTDEKYAAAETICCPPKDEKYFSLYIARGLSD